MDIQIPGERPYWELTGTERAEAALKVAKRLASLHLDRQQVAETERERLYEGDEIVNSDSPRSEYNVIQSTVDAFTSQLVRQRVRPLFLTDGGSAEERARAEGMGRACEAQFEESGLYGEDGIQVARAGLVHGTSAVKMVPDYEHERILIEWFSAAELLVDERDARYGHPRQLCHRQLIPREVLVARYPKFADRIKEVPSAPADLRRIEVGPDLTISEQVAVYEIWHLPSGRVDTDKDSEWGMVDGEKPTHDGVHLLLVEPNGELEPLALLDEPWPIQRFPVVVFRPHRKLTGFWGSGFAKRLKRVQLRINKMLARVDGIMDLHAKLTLVVNKDAKVKIDALSNDWSRVVECVGPPSQALLHVVPQTVGQEYLARIDKLVQWAHDVVGISELSLMGKKPPGIESGTAIRTVLDKESVRHSDLFRQWETFHVELAHVAVEGFRLMARKSKDFAVMWATDKELSRIKWKDQDLSNDRWRLRVWPINLFPQTPTAKMEKLTELARAGGITQDQLTQALSDEYPDVRALVGDKDAMSRNIERKLALLKKDKAITGDNAPHGFLDLAMAKMLSLARLNAAEADSEDGVYLTSLRQWIELVDKLIVEAAQKAQANAPPATPEGAPAPAPAAPAMNPLAGAAPLPAPERQFVQ